MPCSITILNRSGLRAFLSRRDEIGTIVNGGWESEMPASRPASASGIVAAAGSEELSGCGSVQKRPVFSRGNAHGRLELSRERAVVVIATAGSDIGDAELAREQPGGGIEPCLQQHLTRGDVEDLVEVALH